MAHIVIIGQGLQCLTAALQLKKLMADEDWVTIISRSGEGIVRSALPYVSVGLQKVDAARLDIAEICERFSINLTLGSVRELHPERQVVVMDNGRRVPFDYLVISDGMEPAKDHIPGLVSSQHMVHSLTSDDETMRAEIAFQDFLNSPGPMTVACAPGAIDYQSAYQYVFNVDRLLRRHRLRDKVPLRFVTPEPFPGHFGIGGVGNSARLLEGEFRARQIQWTSNAAIDRVDEEAFHVVHFDDDGLPRGRKMIETRFGLLWPAMRAERYITEVEGLTDRAGLIRTNRYLQSVAYPNIFALGEIVAPTDVMEPTPMETGHPCSDFLRESMTSTVAGNLGEVLRKRYPVYEPTGNGFFMIDFGDRGAAFLAVPQCPPRNIDRIIEGRFVHVVKRSMERYHLRKLRSGVTEPLLERLLFRLMKMPRMKQKAA
ncbi:MAG: pyridine nucleotide-disulfide oxidoreductase [Rhodomicrobium sp.]|nr:MAG: pyridine nucleotide-disulfide oxidoreductase [Rhodomicrobium sp.]